MNRIYQGRVGKIEVKLEDGSYQPVPFSGGGHSGDQSTCPLWLHHQIFQDAVNYYLLAMASLAKQPVQGAGRLMGDLPARVAEAWEVFPRQDAARAGARSLRESVGPWLGLDQSATLQQAYEAILKDNAAVGKELSLALALVLDQCSGESGIQQGGREYLPKLCDSKSKATYSYSSSTLESGKGKEQLAHVLHGEPTDKDLKELAASMELSWTVKVSPGKFYEGPEAIARLSEAISHVETMLSLPSPRLAESLLGVSDWVGEIAQIKSNLKTRPEGYKIARNRKAAKDLTFSSIAFMAFPCQLTRHCLRLGLKAPKKEPKKASTNDVDYSTLGDDPVNLSRGSRGYVFPAFTSLPSWNPKNPGEPVWKEFDIAAFKEALKALNQFRLKTEEREERKKNLEGLIAHLIGAPIEGWKPLKEDSGEEGELPDPLDLNLLKLAWELEEEMTRGLSESIVGESNFLPFGKGAIAVRDGGWTVTRASLRGLRDIVEDWMRIIAKNSNAPREEFVEAVKAHQRKEGKAGAIGSVGLFFTLCEPKFHPLWMNTSSTDDEADAGSNRFLNRLADLHESVAEHTRCKEPVNLTPAEPRHSRRAFMFSDLNGRSAAKYVAGDMAEVSIAHPIAKIVKETRCRLHFSSPRLRRDGLLDSEEGWLQPMTKALGLKLDQPKLKTFDSALSLMPDWDSSGGLRYLINFAASIDAEPLRSAIGKFSLWGRQFNGTKDKNIHLHWPGTVDVAKMKVTPWWNNPEIIESGFTVLSTDLGQRTAGAWGLLRITSSRPETPRPVRSIGNDGAREWFAEVLKTGMHRLPGEDAVVRGKDGQMAQELSGKTGRMASEGEWAEALELAAKLLADDPKSWVGSSRTEKSYPEQNGSLVVLANRRLSRLATFHRWSCFDPDKESDPKRRESMVAKLIAELTQWEDTDVTSWASKLGEGDVAAFKRSAGEAFAKYRRDLLPLLVKLANRVCPLRNDLWAWKERGDASPYGDLVRVARDQGTPPPIRGQRGLSLARIEQLEGLRKLFLRYNRALDRSPGTPAKFGRADEGRASGEPCSDLLKKIDNIKEQRVNQTAHLILAQALGVKLAPHSLDAATRRDGDHHGEYAKITGREPVDLVVIENLDRYLTSQGRSPSENSRLMKWSHRAIRDKVKMLIEEPFGIPVLEVPASYSSRFCAVTSEPGSRCEERAFLDDYLKEMLNRRANTAPPAHQSDMRPWHNKLLGQFEKLAEINAKRSADGKPPKTLLLPKTGGPLFLGAIESPVVQSDMNAAINLGFRAVAAPEALHLLHRVRSQTDGQEITTVAKNARERAAYGKKGASISMKGTRSSKLSKSANFFHDVKGIARFDRGEITIAGTTIAVASSIGIWHAVNESILPRIVAINEQRLGLPALFDDKDELPM